MKCNSLDDFKQKEGGHNQLYNHIRITKEALLTRSDFNWLQQNLENLSSVIAELGFSLQAKKDQIKMHASRLKYSVEICFWEDDNLTGFPKVTVDVFTNNVFLPLLENMADRELAKLIHTIFLALPILKPALQSEASKSWPLPDIVPVSWEVNEKWKGRL